MELASWNFFVTFVTNVLLLCIEDGEMHLHCLIQSNFTCNSKHLHYIALNLGFSLQSLLRNPSDLNIVNPLISSIFSSLTLFNEWKWHQLLSPALRWPISHTSHNLVIWSKFHQGFWLKFQVIRKNNVTVIQESIPTESTLIHETAGPVVSTALPILTRCILKNNQLRSWSRSACDAVKFWIHGCCRAWAARDWEHPCERRVSASINKMGWYRWRQDGLGHFGISPTLISVKQHWNLYSCSRTNTLKHDISSNKHNAKLTWGLATTGVNHRHHMKQTNHVIWIFLHKSTPHQFQVATQELALPSFEPRMVVISAATKPVFRKLWTPSGTFSTFWPVPTLTLSVQTRATMNMQPPTQICRPIMNPGRLRPPSASSTSQLLHRWRWWWWWRLQRWW